MTERVEVLLQGWALTQYRTHHNDDPHQPDVDAHLRDCPDTAIVACSVDSGVVGCDTGCELVKIDLTVSCPHGHSHRWVCRDYASLDVVIAELFTAADQPKDTP